MSLYFGSSGRYLNVSSIKTAPANIWSNADGGTVAWWHNSHIKASTVAGERIDPLSKWISTAAGWQISFLDVATPACVRFIMGSSGMGIWRTSSNIWSTGEWTHIAITYNAASGANDPNIYINGTTVTATEIDTPSMPTGNDVSANIKIGNTATTHSYNKMEDLRFVNRMISKNEAKLLAAGYRGPLGGEVLWFAMEGVKDQIASTDYDSVFDKSPSGSDGKPTGGAFAYQPSESERYG